MNRSRTVVKVESITNKKNKPIKFTKILCTDTRTNACLYFYALIILYYMGTQYPVPLLKIYISLDIAKRFQSIFSIMKIRAFLKLLACWLPPTAQLGFFL